MSVEWSEPWTLCSQFAGGRPRAEPLSNGKLCGGADGQPCVRCMRMALGLRGQAEFFTTTMGGSERDQRFP